MEDGQFNRRWHTRSTFKIRLKLKLSYLIKHTVRAVSSGHESSITYPVVGLGLLQREEIFLFIYIFHSMHRYTTLHLIIGYC